MPPTTTSTTSITSTTAAPAVTRQAWLWPFTAASPWNVGVGSGATFEPAGAPATSLLVSAGVTPWINAGSYSHPVFRASAGDPLATVTRPGTTEVATYRIPDTAVPASGTDHHMHVVDPTGRWVDESWLMQGANPTWTTGYHVRNDLQSSGFGAGGVRAYGGSAIGGLIRQWEVTGGAIHHALALAITGSQLKSGWVWPATTQDWDGASSYSGLVPMGSFAAIPPTVDLNAQGLSAGGLMVAKALQGYGAYVVDRSGSFTLYAEPSTAADPLIGQARQDLAKIRALLRLVTNNTPTSVNGGGTRGVPVAPAFG